MKAPILTRIKEWIGLKLCPFTCKAKWVYNDSTHRECYGGRMTSEKIKK